MESCQAPQRWSWNLKNGTQHTWDAGRCHCQNEILDYLVKISRSSRQGTVQILDVVQIVPRVVEWSPCQGTTWWSWNLQNGI